MIEFRLKLCAKCSLFTQFYSLMRHLYENRYYYFGLWCSFSPMLEVNLTTTQKYSFGFKLLEKCAKYLEIT